MLGRKQRSDNAAWLEAVANIEKIIKFRDLEKLSKATVKDIKKAIDGRKAAFAWSGGKDSIVLGHLCEIAGITDCMIGVCDLEFPEFMDWVNGNKPAGCEIVNVGIGMEWLKKNLDMLFPDKSAKAARWFSIVQHKAQRIYYKKHTLDVIMLGRRRADGNYTGKTSNTYTDGNGVTRNSPLAHWKHEEVLAYIHYHKLPLPPFYGWEKGYVCGTHPWPARQHTGSIENGWKEVYGIDPGIVREAASCINSAARFLEGVPS